MDKPMHWLLHSLNHFLHHCEEADLEFKNIQDMKHEIATWRRKYVESYMTNDTPQAKENFMTVDSVNFRYVDPDAIAHYFREEDKVEVHE